jgi:acyl carrier protein
MIENLSFSAAQSTTGDTASRLASVFTEVLSLPQHRIHPNLAPNDVDQWDSVGHVMLVAAVEQEFSIHFEVDEIMEFTDFQSILSAVDRRMTT